MGLVFILRRKAQAGRAERLAKALRQRGVEVCAGLDHEPVALRSVVGRRLVDESALTVAVWQQADIADEQYLDVVEYAGARRKLVQARLEPGPLPQVFAGVPFAPESWLTNEAANSDWCDQVAEYARQARPSRRPHPVSDEYSALSAMHKRGGVEAIERFLADYQGGLFEDIARAELDDATQPVYRPSGSPQSPDGSDAVWRLRSLRSRSAPWLGAAGVVAVAVLAAVFLWPDGNGPAVSSAPAIRSEASPAHTAPSLLTPPAAVAAIALDQQAPTQVDRDPIGMDAATVDSIQENAESLRVQLPNPRETAPPPPAFRPSLTEQAAVRDISQLTPDVRSLVEQARSARARALAEALRQGVEESMLVTERGSGLYRGQRSNGEATGAGRVVWANGDVYAGSWSGSRPEGFGVLDLASGARFEGEFASGAPTGRGVFWDADGHRLTGDRLFAELVRARAHD